MEPKEVVQSVAASSGEPLSKEHRERFEQALGHDFSSVRIHTDSGSEQAAEDLGAHAFTVGADIFFGPGEFAPGTATGDRLLAHELTHVVQHERGALGSQGGVTTPSEPVEQEAHGAEARIASRLRAIDAVGDIESPSPIGISSGPATSVSTFAPRASLSTAETIARAPDEDSERTQVTAPDIKGKVLGEWEETLTSAKLVGGELIPNPKTEDGSFDSHGEAHVWATAVIAQKSAHGGAILVRDGRYFTYTIISKAWFDDFDRDNLESGFDTLQTASGEVSGIQSFLTKDGYAATPTVKTVRAPVAGPLDVTGQMAEGTGKFANATGTGPFEVAVYGHFDDALLQGRTLDRAGNVTEKLLPDGTLVKTMKKGESVTETRTQFWDKLERWLNQGIKRSPVDPPGADKVARIVVRMENGGNKAFKRVGDKWILE
ncbi:MAG: DUF4157 domain-containing protein [Proteobacteria bacterium]|nr:DUF4157 domain-containing protein [Pseudomonadota bacterium]